MSHHYNVVCRFNHRSPWALSLNLFSLLQLNVSFSHISYFSDTVIHKLRSLLSKYQNIFYIYFFSVWVFGSYWFFISIALSLFSRAFSASFAWPTFCTGVWLIPTSRHLSSKHFPHCDYQWALLNELIHWWFDLCDACCIIQDHTCPCDLNQAIIHLCRSKGIHVCVKETYLLQ